MRRQLVHIYGLCRKECRCPTSLQNNPWTEMEYENCGVFKITILPSNQQAIRSLPME